jgi:hypothetical protein
VPGVNPNAPGVSPGTAKPGVFPQWGVKQTGSGGANDYTVKEAKTEAQKTADLKAGYDIWFATPADAGSYVSSQNSVLNGNAPVPASPLTQLEHELTSSATWVRVAKVAIGSVLVVVGLIKISGAQELVTRAAGKAIP